MVELRKRPAPAAASAPPPKRSASKPRATAATKAKKAVDKVKAAVTGESSSAAPTEAGAETTGETGLIPETVSADTATAPADPPAETVEEPAKASQPVNTGEEAALPLSSASVSQVLPASALALEITTHDATPITLSDILSSSTTGVILFTYPKASTPGCTTQACLFRDNFDDLSAKGYTVYGLSADSPKANTTFKAKQNLQYTMLCDPEAKVTEAIGMKKPGNAKGTLRGVVVLAKSGAVEVWFQGGPAKTLDAVTEALAK